MAMQISLAKVKERYPEPIRQGRAKPASPALVYCVAGAFLSYVHNHTRKKALKSLTKFFRRFRFPGVQRTAVVFQLLNPTLSDWTAFKAASRVIELNDRADYAAAWRRLDLALKCKQKGKTACR